MNKQRSNWSRGGGSFRGGWGRGNRGGNWNRNFRGRNDRAGNFGSRGSRQGGTWQRRDTPSKRLSEEDIGITEYVSKHSGFSGIIKSRYSDFQVSEIGEDGRVAKLTDIKPPQPPQDEAIEEDEELLLTKYNPEILPMEMWDKINTLVTSAPTADTQQKIEIDATEMSKEQRTKIHDAVKKAFGSAIISSTVNLGDKKLLTFQKYKKGVRVDMRVKWAWPAEYVYFIVHKENVDSMEAAVRIADKLHLGIKPTMVGYAGTKDRRAKTSQWFSLRKVDPRKIAAACDSSSCRDLRLGNYEFRNDNLVLGMLKGNKFRIALRNVTAEDEVVAEACEQLKEKGFINYYGLQRFGTRLETPTHLIGLHLLQGKFKEAIEAILEERDGPLRDALRAYKEGGPQAALREWPRKYHHAALELRLLRALGHNPKDLVGAMGKLARNTRLLYIHSYQSMIWNRAVSERIRRFGLSPAVGDIVPLAEDIKEELDHEVFEDDEETDESTDMEESQNGDDDKMADTNKMADGVKLLDGLLLESSIKQSKNKIPVKTLTQQDIDAGTYSIFDIVLPLPGHMIEYPPNMKDYYEELLAKDGLTLEMKHKIKSYTLSGAYRYAVIRPADVAYRVVRYSDPFADLILSDWDKLQGVTHVDGIVEDGKYKALLLNFSLPASCYATMALREVLKRDTSSDAQAQHNHYHKQPAPAPPAPPPSQPPPPSAEDQPAAPVTAAAAQETQSKDPEVNVTQTAESQEPVKQTNEPTTASSEDLKREPQEIAEESRTEESQAGKRRIEVKEESGVKKLKKEVDNN